MNDITTQMTFYRSISNEIRFSEADAVHCYNRKVY